MNHLNEHLFKGIEASIKHMNTIECWLPDLVIISFRAWRHDSMPCFFLKLKLIISCENKYF